MDKSLRWEMLEERLAQVPMLRALPEGRLREVSSHLSVRRYARNANVWRTGDAAGEFGFVLGGRIKLVKEQPSGKATILQFLGPGRLLCANLPYRCGHFCCAAIVDRDETEVLSILRQHLLELLARHPLLMQAFLEELSCRTVALCSRVEDLGVGKVEQRIARLLSRLVEQMGLDQGADGVWVPMALSRRDIAEMCATTVETAIRVMSRFEKDGLLITRSRGFLIRSVETLSAKAEGLDERSLLRR